MLNFLLIAFDQHFKMVLHIAVIQLTWSTEVLVDCHIMLVVETYCRYFLLIESQLLYLLGCILCLIKRVAFAVCTTVIRSKSPMLGYMCVVALVT